MTSTGLGTAPAEDDAVEADNHATAATGSKITGKSPRQLAVMRFRKDKGSLIAGIIVALFILIAISAPLLTSLGVLKPLKFTNDHGVSLAHPLGTEPDTGRDVFSRLLLGTTFSMTIALLGTLGAVVIGVVLGLLAGASGGFADTAIGRFIDLTLSFPQTLMLLALSGGALMFMTGSLHMGRNFASGLYLIVVLAAFGWPVFARLVRAQVLSLREREFIDAAKVLGASKRRIYLKEMLPNLWAPILIYGTLTMPAYVSAEAALSYLGVGIKPPTPTLGNILRDSVAYDASDPVYFWGPAVFLAIIVISFNLLGDGLRDALDPKSDR